MSQSKIARFALAGALTALALGGAAPSEARTCKRLNKTEGAVVGAVAGGVLGNQVGGGRGQDAMTVIGAVAGGIAGNQIEKKVRSTKSYEIMVRMEDGSTKLLSESVSPSWRSGDKVKVIDGRIQPYNG